jgi:hypothetical protein
VRKGIVRLLEKDVIVRDWRRIGRLGLMCKVGEWLVWKRGE